MMKLNIQNELDKMCDYIKREANRLCVIPDSIIQNTNKQTFAFVYTGSGDRYITTRISYNDGDDIFIDLAWPSDKTAEDGYTIRYRDADDFIRVWDNFNGASRNPAEVREEMLSLL